MERIHARRRATAKTISGGKRGTAAARNGFEVALDSSRRRQSDDQSRRRRPSARARINAALRRRDDAPRRATRRACTSHFATNRSTGNLLSSSREFTRLRGFSIRFSVLAYKYLVPRGIAEPTALMAAEVRGFFRIWTRLDRYF